MEFGATLRLLRMGAGFTIRDLAEKIGVSSVYLSRVEHGHDGPPTPDRLAEIARVLRLPPDLLIELSDNVTPVVARYLQRVPAANALFVEIARRDLSPPQIAHLKSVLDRDFPAASRAKRASLPLSALITPDRVVARLSCDSFEEAIEVASIRLAPTIDWQAADLVKQFLHRERHGPSAVGEGVAIPHVVSREIEGSAAALITFADPLRADTPDGEPLSLIVAFVTGDRPKGTATSLLAQAARLAKSETRRRLETARNARDVVEGLLMHEAIYGID